MAATLSSCPASMSTPNTDLPRRQAIVGHVRVRAWLQTRRDIADLQARLHLLDLLARMGVRARPVALQAG